MKTTTKIPDFMLEKALLKELPACELVRIEKILKECPEEMKRYEDLKKMNQEFFNKYNSKDMIMQIKTRYYDEKTEIMSGKIRRIKRNLLVAIPSVAAVAIFLILFFPFGIPQGGKIEPGIEETTRLKGLNPHLVIYQKKGSQVEVLKPNDFLKKSDLIQIGYVAAGYPYGVIFSIDGFGSVTLHYPESETSSTFISETKKEILIPHAYELDNAPQFERFIFIVSKEPLFVSEVLEEAKKLAKNENEKLSGKITLKKEIEQFSFILKKGVLQ